MRLALLSLSFVVALMCTEARAQPTGARLVAECDRLAASDIDPNRPQGVRGIPFAAIDGKAALAACSAALTVDRADPRILFQTGRALLALKQHANAREAFRLSHKTGYLIATETLAMMLNEGLGGPQDRESARGMLEDAAASGRPVAMRMLGIMVAQGLGGPQNAEEARQLFADAMQGLERYAAAGSATAMCLIAAMHENGEGVPSDAAEAKRWHAKAVAGGGKKAKPACPVSSP